MRKFLIGQMDEKIMFTQLPKVGDPIVKGLDKESELVACFLSEWNSKASVQTRQSWQDAALEVPAAVCEPRACEAPTTVAFQQDCVSW